MRIVSGAAASGKTVLVTGAGGFIGSHLCEGLVRSGYRVHAFVHYNSKTSWGWLDHSELRDHIHVTSGDLRDFDSVYQATEGAHKIYHLGALIGIPYSYVSPLAYVKTNIEGTYNILESARRRGVSKTTIISTSEVYGSALYVPIDEAHPLQPQSPYSASKIGADQLALSYYNSFKLPVCIARPFNTFGPRQSARAIIPAIATQLLNGVQEIKLGNVTPTRDLTFVEDTASGIEAISECDAFLGKVVNIGVGHEISIRDLFETLCSLTGKKATILEDSNRVRPTQSEVNRLLSDNSYLKKHTDWTPKFDLEAGLKLTLEWLEKHLHHYKPELYHV